MLHVNAGSRARLAMAAFALALAVPASALSEEAPEGKRKVETIIIRGDPIQCRIQKYNDSYIWIVPVSGDMELTPIQLPWSALDPTTVRQVRGKEERASAIEKLLAEGGGDMVEALRIRLKNKTVFVALEVRERSTDEVLVVRRKNIPEARYLRKNIASTETVMLPMTEFYTKEEIYLTEKAEKNPETARDHVALAEEMMKIRHWPRAIEHFERACILDENFVESTGERIAEAKASKVVDDVKSLDLKIRSDYRAQRWRRCLSRIDQLSAFDPDSPIRTKWDAKREEIIANLQKDLRRQIVSSYYRKMTDLINKRAYGLVSDGEVPGVIVTTKSRGAVRGTLVSDDDEFVVVESEGKTLRIAKSLVTQLKPVDLSIKTRRASFSEAKDYVSDETGGLTADILTELEEEFRKYGTKDNPVTQESIKEMWDNRLTWVITITQGGTEKTGRVYSFHEAEYKTGTWLREGAAIAPGGGGDGGGRGGRGGRGGNTGNSGVETDPEKWWQKQPFDVRANILRAIAAEALCDVQNVIKKRCPTCGGTGFSKQLGGTASGNLSAGARLCPTCRGMRFFVKIRYR
ncbi:MAG: hypothetical protein ACYTKD_13155 [Planctomycetota bacterium]|jgi:hypothetical protein